MVYNTQRELNSFEIKSYYLTKTNYKEIPPLIQFRLKAEGSLLILNFVIIIIRPTLKKNHCGILKVYRRLQLIFVYERHMVCCSRIHSAVPPSRVKLTNENSDTGLLKILEKSTHDLITAQKYPFGWL